MKSKESLANIQKTLLEIEKTLHAKQLDLRHIISEIKNWQSIKQELDAGISSHKNGEVLAFLPEYKSMVRDLTITCQEIDKMLDMQDQVKESIENLIKKHEEYNSIYEQWYIYKSNTIVDLNDFKQGRSSEKDGDEL